MGVFGKFFEIFMYDFSFFLYVRSSSSRSNNLWWGFSGQIVRILRV